MEVEKKEAGDDEGPRMDRPGGEGESEEEEDDFKVGDEASLRSAFLGDQRSSRSMN